MITYIIITIISFLFLTCIVKKNTPLTNAFFSNFISLILVVIINTIYFAKNYNEIGEYTKEKTYKITNCDILSDVIVTTDNERVYFTKDELEKNASYSVTNDSVSYIKTYYSYFGNENQTNKWILYDAFPYKNVTFIIKLNQKDYQTMKPFIDKTNPSKHHD